MKTRKFEQSNSGDALRRVHWTKIASPPRLMPHTEMLRPEGMTRQGLYDSQSEERECLLVYDYTYVLKELPELRRATPPSLIPGSAEHREALRIALEKHHSNTIETWADAFNALRSRLKMTIPEFAKLMGRPEAVIRNYLNGRDEPKSEATILAALEVFKEHGDEELLEKVKQVALAEYRSKLDSLILLFSTL